MSRAVDLGPDDVLLNTHGYGLWVGGVALDTLAGAANACVVPAGPSSPSAAFELFAAGDITALAATPSYVRRLFETAEMERFDLAGTGLRLLFCGGEPAEQALRDRVLERMPAGCDWVELYGLTETCGPTVGWGRGSDPTLELNTDQFHVEILGLDRDEPASPDQVGELTLTSRRAGGSSPLVRYRTGDVARAARHGPDGVVAISRILGRRDDAIKVRGVLIYPSSIGEILTRHLAPSADWRLLVRSEPGEHDQVEVQVEASDDICRRVASELHERLAIRVDVRSVHRLPRSRTKTSRAMRVPTT